MRARRRLRVASCRHARCAARGGHHPFWAMRGHGRREIVTPDMQLRRIPIALLAALIVLAGLAAGCGDSNKPAYCGKVDDFQSAFDDLKGVDVKAEGPDAVVSAAKKVKSTGEAA